MTIPDLVILGLLLGLSLAEGHLEILDLLLERLDLGLDLLLSAGDVGVAVFLVGQTVVELLKSNQF